MKLNDLSYQILGCAFKVHTNLGPGLLESAYETCMVHELIKKGFNVERQKILPLIYDGLKLDAGYRIDIIVNNRVLLEIKSVSEVAPIHTAQVITYLKLSGIQLGLLLNFNVKDMKDGIHRIIL